MQQNNVDFHKATHDLKMIYEDIYMMQEAI